MPGLKFNIVLLDTHEQINKKILKAIAEEFNTQMANKTGVIEARIRDATIDFFKATDTYESLINGDLAAHFGLPTGARRGMVDAIINQIGDSIQIVIKPIKAFGTKFQGQTSIKVLIKDFSDILNMAEAYIITSKGQSLPWLEWLLIKGDRLIVSEHEVRLVSGRGRSDLGIMVKATAGAWRVPAQYSGTVGDNWLTRTLKIYQDQYLNTITKILKQELE